jgi:outer membrane protein OmpA-like peptidoglycan-associated protein
MIRCLLSSATVALVLAAMSWAQTTDSNQVSSGSDQRAAALAEASQNPRSDAPVDPHVAVPDEKDGRDPYGRPVKTVGAAEVPAPPPVPPTEQQEFTQNVKDVYFDFNRAELKSDDQATLRQDAEWLKSHPNALFTIAGQADPRGDIVYNVFLSDQRALATRDALVKMGVPPLQILFAEGWGKLYPVCQQDDESCWGQDRRAHLAPWSPDAGPAHSGTGTASGAE